MKENIAFAQCLISIGIMALLWLRPIARLRRDNFRSKIRKIRDNLFDFMYQNDFDYKTPAYQATRQVLNGMIKGSNYFSVASFIVTIMIIVSAKGQESSSVSREIEKLPDGKLKNALNDAILQAGTEMIRFILYKSISGFFLRKFVSLLRVVLKTFQKNGPVSRAKLIETSQTQLLENAYSFGSPNPSEESKILMAY